MSRSGHEFVIWGYMQHALKVEDYRLTLQRYHPAERAPQDGHQNLQTTTVMLLERGALFPGIRMS